MADRYWVGGTGTWNNTTTTNWSATSGGGGGASAPTSADNVFFNSASNATAYSVTVSTNATCADMTMSGPAAGNVTWAGSSALAIFGSISVASTGVTRSFSGNLTLSGAATGRTISIGVTLAGAVNINGAGGTWALTSALNISTGSLTMTAGSLDTAGFTLTASAITFPNGSSVKSLTLGASSVTLSGTTPFTIASASTNYTFNAGTSTISFSNAATMTISAPTGYTIPFYNVSISTSGAATFTISAATSYNNFTSSSLVSTTARAIILGGNMTVSGALTASGAVQYNRTAFRSSTVGTTRTMTVATNSMSTVDFMDITAAGAASPFSGTSYGDGGGNTNITFTAAKTCYRVGGTATWVSNSYALTSGGAATATSSPLPQDTLVVTNATTGTSLSGNASVILPTLDFSTRTTGYTFNAVSGLYAGGIVLSTGVTSFTAADPSAFCGGGSYNITSSGKLFLSVNFQRGSYTLQDAFSCESLTINGSFNANGNNVVANSLVAIGSTASVTMSSGTWTTGGNWSTSASATVSAGTSTIVLNSISGVQLFSGGGETFYNLDIATDQTAYITEDCTFNNISNSTAAAILELFSGITITLSNFTFSGSSGNQASFNGGGSTLSDASGTISVSYVTISNSNATGGATWNAFTANGNVNGGGNTGWNFGSAPATAGGNFLLFFNT